MQIVAAALEHRAALDEPAQAVALQPAAGLAAPAVAEEGIAIGRFQRADDALLQAQQRLEDTARSLGLGWLETLRRVVLPQVMPGILSGSLIVFGLAASSFAIPGLLGGRRLKMVATLVYDEFLSELNWPLGAAIALTLLAANLIIMLSYNRLLEGRYKKTLG